MSKKPIALLGVVALWVLACSVTSDGGNITAHLGCQGPGGTPRTPPVVTEGPSPAPTPVPCADAANHIGEYACVCCEIVRTYYCSTCSDQPTFLNSHDPYEGYFTALIWGENRQAFIDALGGPPETVFRGQLSCFYGLIEWYEPNQAPEITLRDPPNACVGCSGCD